MIATLCIEQHEEEIRTRHIRYGKGLYYYETCQGLPFRSWSVNFSLENELVRFDRSKRLRNGSRATMEEELTSNL